MQDLRSRQIVQLKRTSHRKMGSLRTSASAISPPQSPRPARRGTLTTMSELRPPRCGGDAEMRRASETREAQALAEELFEFADIGMREVCYALMVDPQKRQIRSCLQAAQLTGSFEAEGDSSLQSAQQLSFVSAQQLSFGSAQRDSASFGSDETRRQPRLRHESSMRLRHEVDSSWGSMSSVLAMAYRRDMRDSGNRLRYSSGGGDSILHVGTSFGQLTSPSPGRAHTSQSPLRLSGWSPHRWGRKDDSFGAPKAQGCSSPFRLPGNVASFGPDEPPRPAASSPPPCLPMSPPRHRIIQNVQSPPTPSQNRLRRAFGLISTSPLGQKIKAAKKSWRQVHPQAVATCTTDWRTSSDSDSSEMAISKVTSQSQSPLKSSSGSDHPTVLPDLGSNHEGGQSEMQGTKGQTPPKSPQPRAARKLIFTESP